MSRPLLTVEGVCKRFGGLVALNEVSCAVAAGSITGLIGPNGSGKSTLFNCIAALEPLEAGRVTLDGERIDGLAPWQVAARGVGRTLQITSLFRDLTVLENLVAVAQDRHDGEAVARARALLERFEIWPLRHQEAGALSYGQGKLVEFARALMRRPKLLMLDEPFAGVNPRIQNRMVIYFKALQADGVTLFVVDHEMRLMMDLCDTVVVMDAGEIILQAPPRVVRQDPRVLAAYFP